ncbi:hypothetical protein KAFR_0E01250 [Kazachstania africana CBS 2517]|uniref:Zn(2)-C6 fungal-type domain-containing protein n=1 Tax=Kazachstania africana (strain ATCC 22294 / BCRC 22015 / CBS 2517 / CECT 1963 / NBRC 1671 / NRRL Y-8276) TaxID=1071382 RepID=H2AV79_KAZAF|nr:hypothetical protein KAFR_0E01250 [Kazachstania africana CBS 2517]CCF58279.1 hypothetical protein KAFR_0E01250 [Kazachstania africana CBS 2517]
MLSNSDPAENNLLNQKELDSLLFNSTNYLSPASLSGKSPFSTTNSDSNKGTAISTNTDISSTTIPILPSEHGNQHGLYFTSQYNHPATSPDMSATTLNASSTEDATLLRYSSSPSSLNDSGNSSKSKTKLDTKVTSTVKDGKGNIVKRKYSRNGCTECKRRRMKCDETKPSCWQCARLNRECVYVLNPKNKKRKTQSTSSSIHTKIKEPPTNKADEVVANADDIRIPSFEPLNDIEGFDTNLLMQNLNDIVNMKLNDSISLNEGLKDFDLDIPDLLLPTTGNLNSVPISFLVNNSVQFDIKLSSFKLGGIHNKYLKVFYHDCLDSIAPFFQDQCNPLRDILLSFAKNENYLLSAILAIGASISFRETNQVDDEKNYCAYLSHCLTLLDEQFSNDSNVLKKIEPIILTVILLAWDCINSMNTQWRQHLKGVTDLFKKITMGTSSKVLNVSKCWFKVMETFASISTVLGGSLLNDDLDLIFDPYDYQYVDSLKFLNIMTPLNEFNLLRGHKEDFDLVIKEVIRSLNVIRPKSASNIVDKEKKSDYSLWSSDNNEGKLSYFDTQKILIQINEQLEYEFIDKSGIIPITSQSHPNNSGIKDNAIDMVTLNSGETIAISWYDISHQTQVLSFLLIVLIKLLGVPRESNTVQEVVKKIMSFFKFVDSQNPPQNQRTCYSNFAVLLAGLNAMDEETRNAVKAYFELNGKKFRRLTEHNLKRLEQVWYGDNKDHKFEDQDVLTW